MRKLIIDYLATDMKYEAFQKDLDGYPVDLIKEIARVSVRDRGTQLSLRVPKNRGKCYYHKHEEGSRKCA